MASSGGRDSGLGAHNMASSSSSSSVAGDAFRSSRSAVARRSSNPRLEPLLASSSYQHVGSSSASIVPPLPSSSSFSSSSSTRASLKSPSPTTDILRTPPVSPPPEQPSALRRFVSGLVRRLRPRPGRRRRGSAVDGSDLSESSSDEDEEDDEQQQQQQSEHGHLYDSYAINSVPPSVGVAASLQVERKGYLEEEAEEQSNLATIDWLRQGERDLLAHHHLHRPVSFRATVTRETGCIATVAAKLLTLARSLWRLARQAFRSSQGWVLCGLVGLVTGTLASMVDMCVHWVLDLRSGVCADNVWLSNKVCCAAVGPSNFSPWRDNSALMQSCPLWHSWDRVLHNWGLPRHSMDDWATGYGVYLAWSGLFGVIAAWLVRSWARYAAGSGIPEIKTILGGAVIRRVLGAWTLLVKCVALILSVSSGLSVGKEGPFVHIGGCVANIMCRIFPRYRHSQAKANEIIAAACAAGVAVAFGAPIGGILYSLEELSSFFTHKTMWRAFFCALIASLGVQYIDPFQDGRLVQFGVDYTFPWQWLEMFPFLLIGVLGGLMGAFFIHANQRMQAFRKASFLSRWPLTEVCIVAMVSSAIKYPSAYLRGNITSLLEALFQDCSHAPAVDPLDMCNAQYVGSTMLNLLFVTLVNLLLTTYSIGMPVPAGLLIPSLATGAAMGRLVGTGVRWLQHQSPGWSAWQCATHDSNCITPGIYALVGGAAMLGGVTRMTVALGVIMLEITGGRAYLLPIIVAILVSKTVGDRFGTDSIYEGTIHALRYPFLDAKHDVAPSLRVIHAMTHASYILSLPSRGWNLGSLQTALGTMSTLGLSGAPVVTDLESLLVVGYITRAELKAGLKDAERRGGSGGSGVVRADTPCYFALLDDNDDDSTDAVSAHATFAASLRSSHSGAYVDLSPLLDPAPVQVNEGMALYRLHDMFCKLGLRYVLVVRFGKLVGIVTKKDLVRTLTEYEHKQHAGKGH